MNTGTQASHNEASSRCTIACYYFPNYHVDPRNELQHGPGWTEWELVKGAHPRFEGHDQPKVPLWGHGDESDPEVMAVKIDAAADHGIDVFIFDWYWYDDGPFLENGLERGFFGAPNNDRLKFALMWANHDWIDIHPDKLGVEPKVLSPGRVSPATFDTMTDHIIDRHFNHPSCWTIEGCPYFSFYDLSQMIANFGSVEDTRAGFDRFRDKVRDAGFPGLHLNAVVWGKTVLPCERVVDNTAELIRALGIDTVTSYVWIHHVGLPIFPVTNYRLVMERSVAYWQEARVAMPVPYHPNVTMGWDSTPRTTQTDTFRNRSYPWIPVIENNTPELFEQALRQARDFLSARPSSERVLTLNSWNEWTEGSYLEPDQQSGMAYLEAIKAVFGRMTSPILT